MHTVYFDYNYLPAPPRSTSNSCPFFIFLNTNQFVLCILRGVGPSTEWGQPARGYTLTDFHSHTLSLTINGISARGGASFWCVY